MEMEVLREIIERLPVADAVLRLGQFVLADEALAGIYERHRGRSYEKVISFKLFVNLIGDALDVNDGNGNQTFTRAIENNELETSKQAAYGKLQRVPISLSMGFLAETTRRLREVFPNEVASAVPACLCDFQVLSIDGKKLKHLPKKLGPARGMKGKLYGGKLVVAMDQHTGLAVAMAATLDGETSDAPLMPDMLEQVRQDVVKSRLLTEDRQFCDLVQPNLLQEGEFFLIRYHKKVSFHRDETHAVRRGRDGDDREMEEDWGWLGMPDDPRRVAARRIVVTRPDTDPLIVVTNLFDADKFPAADLLEVYRHRWDIERLFQRVTEVFHLRKLISSTPRATIFQAAYCFLLANFVTTIRAYTSLNQELPPEDISVYQIQTDVERQLIAWTEVMEAAETETLLGEVPTANELRDLLKRRLSEAWSERWRKTPSSKHTPPEKKPYIKGGHTSIHRLIEKCKAKKAKQRC